MRHRMSQGKIARGKDFRENTKSSRHTLHIGSKLYEPMIWCAVADCFGGHNSYYQALTLRASQARRRSTAIDYPKRL